MNFVLERITQPAIEPVTLAEAKLHLRAYSATTEDAAITALITGGREWVEDYTGRALVDQTWRLTVSESAIPFSFTDLNTVTGIYIGVFTPNANSILLRKAPVLALVSVASVDSVGVETALDVADYEVMEPDSKWPRLVASGSWFGTMRIMFRAGFADRLGSPVEDASVVPERFKQAIKLWVEAMYDRDEKMMNTLLEAAQTIIKPERSELQIA